MMANSFEETLKAYLFNRSVFSKFSMVGGGERCTSGAAADNVVSTWNMRKLY